MEKALALYLNFSWEWKDEEEITQLPPHLSLISWWCGQQQQPWSTNLALKQGTEPVASTAWDSVCATAWLRALQLEVSGGCGGNSSIQQPQVTSLGSPHSLGFSQAVNNEQGVKVRNILRLA